MLHLLLLNLFLPQRLIQTSLVHRKGQRQTSLPGKNDQGVEGKIENVTGIGGARIIRNEVGALHEKGVIDAIDEKKMKRRKRREHVSQEESTGSESHIVVVGDVIITGMDGPQVGVFPGIEIIAVLGTKKREADLAILSDGSLMMNVHRYTQKMIMAVTV